MPKVYDAILAKRAIENGSRLDPRWRDGLYADLLKFIREHSGTPYDVTHYEFNILFGDKLYDVGLPDRRGLLEDLVNSSEFPSGISREMLVDLFSGVKSL
jgi:hypothetical protein